MTTPADCAKLRKLAGELAAMDRAVTVPDGLRALLVRVICDWLDAGEPYAKDDHA